MKIDFSAEFSIFQSYQKYKSQVVVINAADSAFRCPPLGIQSGY